ncbi:MAG: hypothetical protein HUJ66_01295 [Oscillospiraceae bacterium]|nr:hypothetical protein [Oscillospiraceae bacterium]
MSAGRKRKSRRYYIKCILLTLLAAALLFALYLNQRSKVAPEYELTVEGLNAKGPAEAQAMCRSEYELCTECMEGREDCLWVWCGEDKLYLVRPEALVIGKEKSEGHTSVSFTDDKGKPREGYIIDPTGEPNELGRVEICEPGELGFDSVSMSVRAALRKGELSYADAVYLWEKGSGIVIAVKENTYTVVEGNIVSFTDDGGVTRVCYILDTSLD